MSAETTFLSPNFSRRTASLLYDGLLLTAILFFATLVFVVLCGDATGIPKRYFLQVYLWLVAGVYFVWSWVRGGQTLAMQTWHIRIVDKTGGNLNKHQAVKRYILATLLFGLSFLWALLDSEGLYLHDRLTGSRLVLIS